MTHDFIGSGWTFPVGTDGTGGVALASGAQEIEESIALILGTSPGERPMRPEFGCALTDYTFAPLSAHTIGRIAQEVRQSLVRWEPRIDLHGVVVEPDPDEGSLLQIHVTYSIRRTNDPRNLVFPFYVIPSEGARGPGSRPATGSRQE